jgi:hypothetical protein
MAKANNIDFMPSGFFTIEQWRNKRWVTVSHLSGRQKLTTALAEIERRARPGFFRVVQTQRMVWAEKRDGKLHVGKRHAMDPETLSRTAAAFDRDKGKRPSR